MAVFLATLPFVVAAGIVSSQGISPRSRSHLLRYQRPRHSSLLRFGRGR